MSTGGAVMPIAGDIIGEELRKHQNVKHYTV